MGAVKKPNEITTTPKWGVLIYSDGYVAQILMMKPGKDQLGRDTWDLKLKPSDELINRHKLLIDSDDGTFESSIPRDLVIQLSPDPAWTRYLYLLNYFGEETPATTQLNGAAKGKEIMDLKNQLNVALAKAEAAKEKLNLMENEMPKYMKKHLSPMLETMSPLIKDIVNTKPDGTRTG